MEYTEFPFLHNLEYVINMYEHQYALKHRVFTSWTIYSEVFSFSNDLETGTVRLEPTPLAQQLAQANLGSLRIDYASS